MSKFKFITTEDIKITREYVIEAESFKEAEDVLDDTHPDDGKIVHETQGVESIVSTEEMK